MTSVPSRTETAEMAAQPAPSVDREEERQIVLKAIERDQEAFAQLYDRHVVRVYRHIYYMVNDSNTAEDLTAQTFLKAWEAIDRYKERGAPIVAWLLRISHNLTVSYLRSKRDHSELDEAFLDQKMARNPEEALDQASDEKSMREAVLKLRDEQRQVIMLRFMADMSIQEVASTLGRTEGSVKALQHRGLQSLARRLQPTTACP